jgi:hypothetical protein
MEIQFHRDPLYGSRTHDSRWQIPNISNASKDYQVLRAKGKNQREAAARAAQMLDALLSR